MKLVIIGGMGYIGSALLEELRSSESGLDIWIVDKVIVPERLAAYPPHFHYVQADMEDRATLEPVVRDADIVYVLAAAVEAERSGAREELTWRENYEKPLDLIEWCHPDAHILFPSSANVFGGNHEDPGRLFTEEDEPTPKYPYAETKVAVEKELIASGRTYTLLRFGTNFGWAPGIRFNLVANIFTLRALQGKPLSVHGRGENLRPFAHTQDCARALLFCSLIAPEQAHSQVYHVVNDSYSINEIARTVQRLVNPMVEIGHQVKHVVFSSYALSSTKLREAGFAFKWDLEGGVTQLARKLSIVEGRT